MRWLAVAAWLACGCSDGLAPGFDLSASAQPDFGFDPDGGGGPMWSARRPMPGPRQETAVVAHQGKIWVLGGFDRMQQVVATVEIYDPATDTWSAGVALPKPAHHMNATVVGGQIYVAGQLETGLFTATGDVYRFTGTTWEARASLPAGTERGGSFVAAIGDKIYVAGGYRGGGSVTDFSSYDPVMDAWTPLPALPAARDHGCGAAVGPKLYAIGGRSVTITSFTPRVDVFNTLTGAWSPATPMPTARGGAAAAVVNGRIVVAGGEGNLASPKGVFAQVELYDTVTNLWSTLPPMLTPRHGTGGAALGNTFYVPGGADVQLYGAVAAVEAIQF